MDTAIQMFEFENEREIRVIEGDGGEPWFVAKDICDAVEHTNSRVAVQSLDEDEKGVREVYTPGGAQQMMCVNESGMYALVIRSNKPEAKRFRKWVTSEVLPALRKHGFYAVPGRQGMSLAHQALAMAQALVDIEGRVGRLEVAEQNRQEAEEKASLRLLSAHAGISGNEYYTVVGYANLLGIKVRNATATDYGKRASAWSRDHGYPIEQVSDPHWGRVNSYCIEALEYAFGTGSN